MNTREEFYKYALMEPKLLVLEKDIINHVAESKNLIRYCANRHWYKEFKPRVCNLVGDFAENKKLGGYKAYDVVTEYLYELLPNCTHDGFCG